MFMLTPGKFLFGEAIKLNRHNLLHKCQVMSRNLLQIRFPRWPFKMSLVIPCDFDSKTMSSMYTGIELNGYVMITFIRVRKPDPKATGLLNTQVSELFYISYITRANFVLHKFWWML